MRAVTSIVCFVLAAGLLGSCAKSPEDLAVGISVSDVRVVDVVLANGRPGQSVVCTITNDNDVPVYAIDCTYRLDLDGSGLTEPAGEKVVDYTLLATQLAAHSSVTKSPEEGFYIITQTDGRCRSASVTVTKVVDEAAH